MKWILLFLAIMLGFYYLEKYKCSDHYREFQWRFENGYCEIYMPRADGDGKWVPADQVVFTVTK